MYEARQGCDGMVSGMNRRLSALSCAIVLLQGCSSLRPSSAPSAAPAASASSAVTPAPSQPAFEVVSKGAERQDGLIPLWRRQDKVWLELSPQMLERPLFLSPKLASGIGEAGVFGGLMQSRWALVGRPQWVTFRKVQQQVQLLAVNAAYTAQAGTPQARAVQAAFSPSLLSSAPLASAPHPKTGAILVEANPLLLGDLLGLGAHLQRSYRQSYALDGRNTVLQQSRTDAGSAVFEINQHFSTSSIAVPGSSPTPPGAPAPSIPGSVPDPRSLFIQVHYTLTPLPAQPMPTRPADARVGYFNTTVVDFSDENPRSPRQRFINRWRLEKKDPDAAHSEPVQPIVFWLDPSIPQGYRPTITAGVLEWNKAFAAIGIDKAIEVRQAPDDGSVDSLQTGHASIRWMTNAQPSFGAIGPSHVDPRTGEILDADIAIESLSSRAIRSIRSQILPSSPAQSDLTDRHDEPCRHGDYAADQLGLGLEVLAAQGVLDPDSPQVREFVLAYLKDTTMHEVGHALGLRHNFRASRWHTADELRHPLLTREQGNSASVMEYAPINLPSPGDSAGAPFQTTLGPYDYWAIEYGYTPLPADKTQALTQLQTIAQRSADPAQADALAYGTDEDNLLGLDPQAMAFDLGRDPIAFARQRVAIVRDLLNRQAQRQLSSQDEAALLRRSVSYGLRELGRTSQILLRQIGGLITRRDAPGGRDLLEPVPATQQRQALTLLMQDFLAPQAVSLPPALQRRLAPDYLERQEGDGNALAGTDFSVAEQLLGLQRGILQALMNDALAERLLDNADKVRDRQADPVTVDELYRQLSATIWQATEGPGQASWRRNLQREYVNRLALAVVRPGTDRADTRAIVRQHALHLLTQLRATSGHGSDRVEAAHRRDCIDTLSQALAANLVRGAF